MAGYKVYLGLNGSDVDRILKAKPSIAVIDFAEFDDKQIKKMAKVCKRYGETISVGADGHIKINDRKDFETVIKAMCDYYKKGEVSGKSYGTFSGRELKEVEK